MKLTIPAKEYLQRLRNADAPLDHELVTDHSQCHLFWPECKEILAINRKDADVPVQLQSGKRSGEAT